MMHMSDVNLWHARLGHVQGHVLKLIPVSHSSSLEVCDSCHFAKQQRLSLHMSTSVSLDLFDLVHADVWGPYRVKTHGSCSCFLTLLEDKSRTTWVMLLSDKAQVSSTIANFIDYVQTQFHKTFKVLRLIMVLSFLISI